MNKTDWARKLSSRKFWFALAGFVTGVIAFVANPTTDAQVISALILQLGSVVAYCIGEGIADAAHAKADPTVIYVPSDDMFDEQANESEEKVEEQEGGEE